MAGVETLVNAAVSVAVFIAVVFALHYAFVGFGIDPGKAGVEAVVITAAVITMVVLYLFGRTWKRELGRSRQV